MSNATYSNSAYRGAIHSSQDRRVEYHYLNTIMEESDYSESSPVAQKQTSNPMLLREERLREERRMDDHFNDGRRRSAHEDREQRIDMWFSPMSDHFPTPRGFHFLSAPILPSSPSASSADNEAERDDGSSPDTDSPSSSWNRGSTSTDVTDFDIYYASDDEPAPRNTTSRASTASRATSSQHAHASMRAASPPKRLSSSSMESRRALPQLSIPARAQTVALADPDPKLCTSPIAPTPSAQVPMSPAIMSFMQKQLASPLPPASAPPSLDGSMTSEQLSHISITPSSDSAPPTPIIGPSDESNGEWDGIRLQPDALATLHSLSRSDAGSNDGNDGPERVLEVPVAAPPAEEMSESPSLQPFLRLLTSGLPRHTVPFSPVHQRSLAGLTRLEIPSPGGFFSGLSPRTRHTWHMPGMTPVDSAHPPTSGTAEQFYRLPWNNEAAPMPQVSRLRDRPLHLPTDEKSDSPVEQVIEVAAPAASEDPVTAFRVQNTPVTAKRVVTETIVESDDAAELAELSVIDLPEPIEASSPVEEVIATEIVNDYLAIDAEKMQQAALSCLDRTELWLMAQRSYLNGVADLTENAEEIPSPTPEDEAPEVLPKEEDQQMTVSTLSLPRKKTVRFSEGIKSPAAPRILPAKLLHQESAYYRAFTDLIIRSHTTDIFASRLPRFEALQAQRLLIRDSHRNQLLGKYQLTVVPQSAKKRMSTNVVRGDDAIVDDPEKMRAEKDADALRQMAMTTWHVAALKLLNGGRLISAPVHKRLARMSRMAPGPDGVCRDRARILDLGGQATCDWAWHAALQYPNTKVYSVTTKAIRQLSNANIRGPSNHRQVAVEKLTRLPFDDCQFDLVRASELYSILKFVGENGEDEWETCLQECYRVLKPGGYLEFNVLDSDIVNAGPLGNAKSVEFGFSLQTLGYDPAPTKMFLGRLERAEFCDIRRAWVCLPVGPRPESLTKPAVSRDSNGSIIPTVSLDAIVHGSTDNIAALTGLVGSWSWERWLLRAEMEKTAGDLRLVDTVTASPALHEAGKSLDGVHAIVEEGRATGAAWRMLRGYARKPRADMGTINMVLDMGW